jgi:DNA-binding SARP family transcriptional activator
LWPDMDVGSATNSYNQTLYFLRRDVDQWYLPPTSPEYLVNEADLVWLDGELVAVDSVAFYQQAKDLTDQSVDVAAALCQTYGGRFAPEFEYDEWSMGWRDRVHASYLSVVQWTVAAFVNQGRLIDARAVLLRAAEIDPDAMDLDASLIWIYDRLGSRAAAIEQYRRFAAATRLELAAEPPSLETILASQGPAGLAPQS